MWPPFSCKMLRSRHRWTLLDQGLFPAIRGICGHHAWILQQDGAPSHQAGRASCTFISSKSRR